jgi:RNA polymerase sigma factor (sigma-70 family)
MSPPDEQCVRGCLDGHPEAYRSLVDRYQLPLMRRLCGSFGNVEEASEAAQETFVRAYFALGSLRKPEAFFSWLVGIADRVAKETFRDTKRRRAVARQQAETHQPVARQEVSADPELTAAVERLPDVYREVVMLRFYEGQSCDEISRTLKVPLGTVTKRLSRAYSLLRECLRPDAGSRQSEVSP